MTKIHLEIDHASEQHGWMKCYLSIGDERYPLDASGAVPPFLDLLYFMLGIVQGRLPANAFWNEEGFGVVFKASPLPNTEDEIHLLIAHTDNDFPWFDGNFEIDNLIEALLPPILNFSETFPPYGYDWGLSIPLLRLITEAIKTRQFTTHAQIILYQDQESGTHIFNLISNYSLRLYLFLHDSHPFWQEWFDFLGKIQAKDFPAICKLKRNVLIAPFTTHNTEDQVVIFHAKPDEDAAFFHFKIEIHHEDGKISPITDEKRNAKNFYQETFSHLENHLLNNYRIVHDELGNTFDLRTLLPRAF